MFFSCPRGNEDTELLREIKRQNQLILKQQETMMSVISDLQAEVTSIADTEQSAIALLNGLSQSLKDAIASGDPAALTQISADLEAGRAGLAAAITANTPGASAPTPPPADGSGTAPAA